MDDPNETSSTGNEIYETIDDMLEEKGEVGMNFPERELTPQSDEDSTDESR